MFSGWHENLSSFHLNAVVQTFGSWGDIQTFSALCGFLKQENHYILIGEIHMELLDYILLRNTFHLHKNCGLGAGIVFKPTIATWTHRATVLCVVYY
jgi:hypothetical protein